MRDLTEESTLRQKIRSEADEVLFAQVQFDDRMKERVFERIRQEEQQNLRERRIRNKRMRHRWMFSSAAAIAAIAIVASAIWFGAEGNRPDKAGSWPVMEIAGGEDAGNDIELHPKHIEDGFSTLVTTDEPIKLQSVEEAGQWFGDGWRTAPYVPEGFDLREIQAHEAAERSTARVTLDYVADEGKTYTIVADKSPFQTLYVGNETVDIHGHEAHMKVVEGDEFVELSWADDGVQFRIAGHLTREEAIKIARSVYE